MTSIGFDLAISGPGGTGTEATSVFGPAAAEAVVGTSPPCVAGVYGTAGDVTLTFPPGYEPAVQTLRIGRSDNVICKYGAPGS